MGEPVPITLFAGLFIWLILRQHYRTQEKVRLAAIERGLLALPADTPHDLRKTAWVLMALGAGFAIATQVTLSLIPTGDCVAPLAVSIWGIVPILVGAALWGYHRRCRREQDEKGRQGVEA